MKVDLAELSRMTFRATRAADAICEDLKGNLGWPHRYVAARLAIARSLSLSEPPLPLTGADGDDMAIPLRGGQLFGEDTAAQASWLALIVQRSGDPTLSKRSFQALVTAHWRRGAELLKKDWERSRCDMARFVARLAELASFPDDVEHEEGTLVTSSSSFVTGEVRFPVGEVARDGRTGERVEFSLNAAGGSPHMAIMGGVGSGKTRTAIHMLKELRRFDVVPLLAFDFKGDLSEGLNAVFDAEVLSPPEDSIPLDVLHVASKDDNAIKTAAARIRDSISSVKSRAPSGIQKGDLREAIASTLRVAADRSGAVALPDVARALEVRYEEQERKPDELIATLNELTQFDLFVPDRPPEDFFSRSWIIRLPQDGSAEMRRLIINLTLNALDRWLNAQPDAPAEAGVRALRHVTLLDEAHVVLRTKLPALANLVRLSRSKGGVVMLASQSPDDFEGAEDDYLDNMGLTVAFNTQARAGPARRIFGDAQSLTGLKVGEALCRIRAEARTRKIVAWER